MRMTSQEAEARTIMAVAEQMMTAARTAPKACGTDHLEVFALTGKEKEVLVKAMKEYGEKQGIDFIVRDAGNIEHSPVIVLLGAVIDPMLIADCGLCGFENCGQCKENHGLCAFNITDLGIALGSAVSIAADHRIDNRVMYSAGKVALKMGLFSDSVKVAYGVPLSVSSKSPYFDRDSADNKSIKR